MSICKSKKSSSVKRGKTHLRSRCTPILGETHTSLSRSKIAALLFAAICCITFLFPTYSHAETANDNSQSQELVLTQDIYHKHSGNSKKKGGCYTVKKTGTETVEVPCDGTMVYWPNLGSTSCSKCGASYFGDQSFRECWKTTTETRSYTYYALGCGLKTDTLLGTLTVSKNTGEWVKSVTLTGSYEVNESVPVDALPYIWNDGAPTDNNTFEVTACGEYSLSLNAGENVNAKVVINVRNVDVTAPAISAHTQEPKADWTKEGVLVSITQVADLQPDGTEGCGLHDTPYSFDGGSTWTAENTCTYADSGTYSIWVKDKLENNSIYNVTVGNIDYTAPTVTVEYDRTSNIRSAQVTINAADLQPDGSAGCGLHETAYSFDNGATWTGENTLSIEKNTAVSIAVRDKLDNIAYLEERVTNIDSMGPQITYTTEPDSWTNGDITLHLKAEDVNEDGTLGSGLPELWYSLDGGVTWSAESPLIITDNQELTITARDLLDNRSEKKITINLIDREKPSVTISRKTSGSGSNTCVKLTANATDEQSGLHPEAYSWNKGKTFSNKPSLTVNKNGTYQVIVRDKAGNTQQQEIKVKNIPEGSDDSDPTPTPNPNPTPNPIPNPIPTNPPIVSKPKPTSPHSPEEDTTEELSTEEEETEEVTTEEPTEEETEVIVTMEDLGDGGESMEVQTLQKEDGWTLGELLLLALLLLALLAILLFLFLLWVRTIAVYVKDSKGNLQYLGRLWIRNRDEHYEVEVPERMMEQCQTTHFVFKPSILFVKLHQDDEIHFLFPKGVCATLSVECEMETILL